MRFFLSVAVMVSLAGCVGAPQSRQELKTAAVEHPSLSVTGSYTSNRRLEDVAAALERKWKECYSVQRTTTRSQGGMTTMNYRDTYHPKSRRVSSSLVEMT